MRPTLRSMRCLPTIVRILVALVVSVASMQPSLAGAAGITTAPADCGGRHAGHAVLAPPAPLAAHGHEAAPISGRDGDRAQASVACPSCDCAAICTVTTPLPASDCRTGADGLVHVLVAARSRDHCERTVAPEIHPPIV